MNNEKTDSSLRTLGYFSPSEISALRGNMKLTSLANERARGEGPPYVKLHGRAIAYPIVDFEAWLSKRTVRPGSAPSPTLANPAVRRPLQVRVRARQPLRA